MSLQCIASKGIISKAMKKPVRLVDWRQPMSYLITFHYNISGLKEKILLHTATYRMMLGANPSKTHLLLKRSSVQQQDQKVSKAKLYFPKT